MFLHLIDEFVIQESKAAPYHGYFKLVIDCVWKILANDTLVAQKIILQT